MPKSDDVICERSLCIDHDALGIMWRACLITLHSNFEIFQKGNPAVEVMLDRRIFER